MYDIGDFFNDNIPDDLNYWDYDEQQRQIECCYEEYELNKQIDALVEERSWDNSLRLIKIQRIAREAREKQISYTIIFKFLKEYDIKPNERVWFWMTYYNNN